MEILQNEKGEKNRLKMPPVQAARAAKYMFGIARRRRWREIKNQTAQVRDLAAATRKKAAQLRLAPTL